MCIVKFLVYALPPIGFICFMIILITRNYQSIKKWCIGLAIIAFVGGILVYQHSNSFTDERYCDLLNVFIKSTQSVYSIVRMFSIEHEHVDYNQNYEIDNICYYLLFWIFRISAFFAIYTAALLVFGKKYIEKLRMILKKGEIYIIKGGDENALLLGSNLVSHDETRSEPDKKRLIIYWLEEDDNEEKMITQANRFGGIVRVLDRDFALYKCFKDIGLIKGKYVKNLDDLKKKKGVLIKISEKIVFIFDKLFPKKEKYNIILMPNDISIYDDVCRFYSLVKKYNIDQNKFKLFIITSSEWERDQIINLKKEDQSFLNTQNLIDEADLITREMIKVLPPYKCSGLISKDQKVLGQATRNFTVLILGFGKMGQNALLRLIMNGQFVSAKEENGKFPPCKMKAIVVDENMKKFKGDFLQKYQGIELCCKIDYKELRVPCNDLFDIIDSYDIINQEDKIDYIVIALNNDEVNKQTALALRLYYRRKNTELPFIAIITDPENITSNNFKIDGNNEEIIHLFGGRNSIFNQSLLNQDKNNKMAKAINETYNKENPQYSEEWDELNWFKQESNRAAADFIPTMLYLANKSEEEAMLSDSLTDDENLKETLAHTEHLRWNAFHVAMGWKPISKDEMYAIYKMLQEKNNPKKSLCRKNEKARLHICLAPWDELDDLCQSYNQLTNDGANFRKNDYNIVLNIPKFLKERECIHQHQSTQPT